MKLDDLTDFVLVATHEGFTQASRQSGRPKASLSRKVMELEASLGVRLFERGPRTIRLTEEGALLLERTSGPLHELTEAAAVLREGKTQPHGLLRINAPTLLGQMMLGRIAAGFTRSYPQVELSVTLEDREVDLIKEGYDLAIRVNPAPNSELVGRRILRDHLLIVSTPAFKRQFARAARTGENATRNRSERFAQHGPLENHSPPGHGSCDPSHLAAPPFYDDPRCRVDGSWSRETSSPGCGGGPGGGPTGVLGDRKRRTLRGMGASHLEPPGQRQGSGVHEIA